jgi:hypothetical protein
MAKIILRNPPITVNGVDLTNHASSVEITMNNDDVDLTSFGANNKVHGVGIGDASIKLKFFQDFAAASVDATLAPIFAAKVPVPIVVKPTTAAVSATNPSYTMQGLMMDYTPLTGSVGQASETDVTFMNGDDTGIVRATS